MTSATVRPMTAMRATRGDGSCLLAGRSPSGPGVGRSVRLPLVTQIQSDRLPAVMRGAGLRLLWVCLAVWGLGMLSPRVTPHQAAVIVFVGAGIVIGLALLLAAGTRRILRSLRIGLVDRTVAGAEALLVLVRPIGLLVLALGFFLFWTLVYLGVWWWHPASAFTGLGPHPYFSDFFYYAVRPRSSRRPATSSPTPAEPAPPR